MDKKSLGKRIREARLKNGYTQERLSEAAEITVVYLSEIERGIKLPSLSLFVRLSEILHTSADALLRDALETLRALFAPQEKGALVVLRSGSLFEQAKSELLKNLKDGERRIIFSSYQTLGAGQNLQYSVDARTGTQSE